MILSLEVYAKSPSIDRQVASDLVKIHKKNGEQEIPIEVSADHVKQDTAKNMIYAKGKVIVRYGQKAIQADRIKINSKTGRGEAVGNVILKDVGSRLAAERARFNLKGKQERFIMLLVK